DLDEKHLCDAVPGTYFSQENGVNNLLWLDNSQDSWFGYHKNVYSDTINARKAKVIGGSEAFSPALISMAENFGADEWPGVSDNEVYFQQFDVSDFGLSSVLDIGDTTVLTFSGMGCANITTSTAFA